MSNTAEQQIKSLMESGYSRIEAIANANLGERSEAAKRVIYKRWRRLEYVKMGLCLATACMLVEREESEKN